MPFVPEEPARGCHPAVEDAVTSTGWNIHFIPGFQSGPLAVNFDFQIPLKQYHQLVSGMDEIKPLLSGRVHPEPAVIPLLLPHFGYRVAGDGVFLSPVPCD